MTTQSTETKSSNTVMTAKQKMILALCAIVGVVVIVVTTVLGTVAYLTSSAAVSNVFTIGNVGITMTESKVDADGKKIPGAERVDTNTYHLVPDKTYDKDPTIFVTEGSEASYLFVLVRNDLEAIADTTPGTTNKTIAQQLEEKGWARYTKGGTGWVYVYCGISGGVPTGDATDLTVTPATFAGTPEAVTGGTFVLFENFSIDPKADVSKYGAAKITLTAVAIQNTGFANIDEAWAAVVETYPYIHTGNN